MYILVIHVHILKYNIQHPSLYTFHSYILVSYPDYIAWKSKIIFGMCKNDESSGGFFHVNWVTLPWIIRIKIILFKNLHSKSFDMLFSF